MVYLILLFFIFIILILLFFIKKLKNNIQILSDTLVKTNKILSEEKQKDKQIIF
jgi:Sec-independent protein translocase protein TatA